MLWANGWQEPIPWLIGSPAVLADAARSTALDQLIQYDFVLAEETLDELRALCRRVEWKRSRRVDRFTFQLEPGAGISELLVDAYLERLPEAYRRSLAKGIEKYNQGWTGQLKLSKYVAPSRGFPFHADQWQKWPGRDWRRILTSLTYLNDDYEGGGTRFAHGREIVPESGRTLTFPTAWVFTHQGDPIARGTKYLLVVHIWS